MKIPFKWEEIEEYQCEEGDVGTSRAKVFGGWIVNSCRLTEVGISESMVFIPDPEHKWEL